MSYNKNYICINSQQLVSINKYYLIAFILIIAVSFPSYSKKYARKNAISWEELQNKINSNEIDINVNLSDSCPNNIDAYQEFKGLERYSYIYFSDYYWKEYMTEPGKICIVKYHDSMMLESNAKILSKLQSEKLIIADIVYGFSRENKAVLNGHLMLQKRAVKNHRIIKYGGFMHVKRFLEENSPEMKIYKEDDIRITDDGYASIDMLPVVDFLERSFSKDTLEKLIKEVKASPPNRISNGMYPFETIEDLMKEAKRDLSLGYTTIEEVFKLY